MNGIINGKCNPIIGFAGNSGLKGEKINIIISGFFTSDNQEFFKYIESIDNHFGLSLDKYSNFLIVLKKDYSFTFYNLDENGLVLGCLFGNNITKGTPVYKTDILGIDAINLDRYNIDKSDSVIFGFRNNWKHGLYFNFSPLNSKEELNLDILSKELGKCYNFLFYNKELSFINNNEIYNLMLKDGWYPFFSILNDYQRLYDFYKEGKNNNNVLDSIINKFNKEKFNQITSKWYNNNVFKEKSEFLNAGINSFLSGTQDGYINCLKNLGTEIEGLLHIYYFGETGKYSSHSQIIEYLKNRVQNSNKSSFLTIGFNEKFIDYLVNKVFGKFDLKSGKIDFSRHTTGHGVAKVEDYNKYKAFQYILIIDQLYYYFIHK